MSYIVLARKYRPQTFDEVIGQSHITDLLQKSIQSKRLAHAYLFCGPRGIGKTSCARILAKSLNCKNGPTLTPCGECPACKEITNSNSFDVIEIDGASNRGIDEIRTLRENVKFAPSYGRYKIYIVDEVHMLTTEAFNALLKTLEEPPEHAKFILATTAANKVPATIISRCQRFDFRRVSVETIQKALRAICSKEKIKIKDDALFMVSKAASGSLRDALSILDQLSALIAQEIETADVYSMLGIIETELLFELVESLAKKNCAQALDVFDKISQEGKDIKQLNRDLIEHFRNLMVIKIGGKALGKLVDYPVAIKEMILTQAQKFLLKEILAAIDVFVEAQEFARRTDSLTIPLEVAFARLTYTTEPGALPEKLVQEKQSVAEKPDAKLARPRNVLANQKGYVDFSADDIEETGKDLPVSVAAPEQEKLVLSLDLIRRNWDAITHAISREKMSVATFLQEGSPSLLKGEKLTISFSPEAVFHKESLEQKDNLRLIEKIFSEKLGTMVNINLKVDEHHQPHQNQEPFVKAALDTFQGKVVSKWNRDG
ncbi:MAG: DNA polymerase III subunit gamma/tau [Candidatus Omnitrophota bacterium]